MKAFLSHSRNDKHFVRAVADSLGSALCEYDEYTFEFILSAQAIRQAFARCDLFVFFYLPILYEVILSVRRFERR